MVYVSANSIVLLLVTRYHFMFIFALDSRNCIGHHQRYGADPTVSVVLWCFTVRGMMYYKKALELQAEQERVSVPGQFLNFEEFLY